MEKYTKGDWFVSGGSEIVSMPSQCKICKNVSGWNPAEAEANAQLISAAPDLLEAAKMALQFFVATGRVNFQFVELLTSAIGKAEGK